MRRALLGMTMTIWAGSVWAVGSGGYTNQVVDTKALGMGNAFTAVADNPSALFFNPAGLSSLTGTNLSLGVAPHFPDTTYDAAAGGSAQASKSSVWVPNGYFSRSLGENLGFGLGFNAPFGLETHWADTSSLRYVATDSRLKIAQGHFGAGWRALPSLSVGLGGNVSFVDARLSSALNVTGLNFVLPGPFTVAPDGGRTMEGKGYGVGGNVGVLWQPAAEYSLGVNYRTRTNVRVKGQIRLSGLSGNSATAFGGDTYSTDAETSVYLPESFSVGLAYKPTQKITFAMDGERVGYSIVQKTSFDFPSEQNPGRQAILTTGNPTPRDWQTTWNLGTGVDYKASDQLHLRTGYFYYPHVVPEATWDPSTPDASRHGFTLGGSVITGPIQTDLAYNYILFNERTINNTVGASAGATVNGSYKSRPQILSVNLTYHWR